MTEKNTRSIKSNQENIETDISTYDRYLTRLVESEEIFHTIATAALDAIIMMDHRGNVSFWNKAAEDIFGYKTDEISGKNVHKILAPKNLYTLFEKAYPKFLETGTGDAVGKLLELSAIKKDGSEFPIEITLSSVQIKGKWNAIAIIRDITKRKQAEHEKNTIFNIAPDGMRMVDNNFNITKANNAFCDFVKYPKNEVIGKKCYDVFPGKFCNTDNCTITFLKKTNEDTFVTEVSKQRKDGTEIQTILTANSFKDSQGKFLGVIENYRDITKDKKAALDIREKEEELRLITESSMDMIFMISKTGRILYISHSVINNLGYTPDEVVGKMFTLFVPKKELMNYWANIKQVFNGKRITDFETVIKHKDGYLVSIEITGQLIKRKGKSVGLGSIRNITERKRTEDRLKKSEYKYQTIFNTADVSIWVEDISALKNRLGELKAEGHKDIRKYIKDHPGFLQKAGEIIKVVDINDATVKMYDADSKEHLLGSLNKILLPDTSQILEEEIVAIAEGKSIVTGETVNRTLKGRKINILLSMAIPATSEDFDSVILTILDITDQKAAKEDLVRSETKHRTVFESSTDAIMLLKDGIFVDCNQATVNIFGCKSKSDIINKPPTAFSPEFQPEGVNSTILVGKRIMHALKHGSDYFEWTHSKLNGIEFPAEVLLTAMELDGQKVLQATVRDISERKEAETALKEASDQLEARVKDRTAELTHMHQDKDRFISRVSHDLRTPIAAILGFASLLLKGSWGGMNPSQTERLVKIIGHAERMNNIIGDLLSISRIESGKIGKAKEKVDIIRRYPDFCVNGIFILF
ncbi:MAG: PAS domain S-box protein [Candidatus Marinimicrobia bacterium]|nr:PAS domain S-box protein [Candidatus Neomarinimicrobiota bacterium]